MTVVDVYRGATCLEVGAGTGVTSSESSRIFAASMFGKQLQNVSAAEVVGLTAAHFGAKFFGQCFDLLLHFPDFFAAPLVARLVVLTDVARQSETHESVFDKKGFATGTHLVASKLIN